MSKTIIFVALNLLGATLVISWLFNTIKDFVKAPNKAKFLTWKRFKYPSLISFLVGIPYLIINYTPFTEVFHIDIANPDTPAFIYTLIIAFLVSFAWIMYIVKLDIYEPERWRDIILVFILAIFTTYLCDILYPLAHYLGLNRSADPIYDFIYCVFAIGLIEETVKFIPFLILLRFTKAINEPYDYLLYASVSALGFAFAENIRYFDNYGYAIMGARTFYAAVAHMTFSSTVTYGLLLQKFKYQKLPSFLVFLVFFMIAIVSHGFYDFWLINEAVSDYAGITTVFFLITIHIWFIMKNNAINISNFYDEQVELNNDKLKHYLVLSLVGIFMLSYVFVALLSNAENAKAHFVQSLLMYGYLIFYLISSFSRFNVIKGYLRPIQIPFNFIIPQMVKPKNNKSNNE